MLIPRKGKNSTCTQRAEHDAVSSRARLGETQPGARLVTWHRQRGPADATAQSLGTGSSSAGDLPSKIFLCVSLTGNGSWFWARGFLPLPSSQGGQSGVRCTLRTCMTNPYGFGVGARGSGHIFVSARSSLPGDLTPSISVTVSHR